MNLKVDREMTDQAAGKTQNPTDDIREAIPKVAAKKHKTPSPAEPEPKGLTAG
jgi:hypothetical protein